jgi:TP901 family phage tail tape measure protein
MALDQETIDLIINAENLTGEELAKVTKDLDRLGKEALEADQKLSKVTIEREQLKRFIELKENISQLQKEINKTETVNKKYVKSVKESGKETAAQTRKIQNNKVNLKDLNSALRNNKKEQDKVGESLKKSGVGIVRYNQSLKRLDEGYTKVRKEVNKTNRVFRKNGEIQEKARIENEKAIQSKRKLIDSLHEEGLALNRLISDERKAHEINKQLILDSEKQRISSEKLTQQKLREARITSDLAKQNRDISNAKKRQIKIDKKALVQAKEELRVKEELRKRLQQHDRAIIKSNANKKKQIELDKQSVIESNRVTLAVKKYNIELEKLNAQLKKGKISHQQFINSEKKLRKQLNLTEKQAKQTAFAIDKINHAKASKSTDVLTKVTRRLAQAYTVLVVAQKAAQAVGASVKGYGELETALTKVEKTTDLSRQQLVAMSEQLQIMANKTTPTASNELLRFAEIAGQLGAESSEDILRMASAADALALSTDLAGEEAVTLLSRMLKMTGEGLPAINNLSSSIVELGNTFAASESEIAQMTKEIITGTTSINLGSAAAAGFGATLKEMGQTGERSRSSLFKLSQAIKSASVNGGQDLKNLTAITKLTGDQIDKSLGEKPEEILIAFVEGLKKVKDQGGLVSKELEKFGITGVEATSVIEVLADQSERLSEAVASSSQAYQDGDKHIKEAIKSYANQDAKIGRLVNTFTELKTKIGEAFADETNTAVDSLSNSLSSQSETIVTLAENLADFGQSVVEQIQMMESLADSLGLFDIVGFALLQIKKVFNDIQIANDKVIIGILELRKWWNALSRDSEEFIKISQQQDEIEERIAGNRRDRANAVSRINGQSSASYEDLLETIKNNEEAVLKLTEAEQLEIIEAQKLLGFKEGSDKAYRKLTASIISQVRNIEVEISIKKELTKEEENIVKAQENRIKQQRKLNALTGKAIRSNGDLQGKINALQFSVKEGFITWDEYEKSLKLVLQAQRDSIPVLEDIAKKTKDTSTANETATESYQDLSDSIREQKLEIIELEGAIKASKSSGKEYLALQRDLANVNKELAENEKDLATVRNLEGKTLSQLVLIQRQHNVELERLEANKKIGLITIAEYNIKLSETSFKTQFLNKAIGENADKTQTITEYLEAERAEREKHLDVLREENDLLDENTDTVEDAQKSNEAAATAVSLWAIARNRLNKELDYSNSTTEELNDKTVELGKTMKIVRQTVGNWWTDLHQLNNQAVIREQTTIKETIALRGLQEQVESGSLSLAELEKASRNVQFSFRNLGDQQLDPLRDAIKDATEEFAELEDTINDSFNDIEDRLDAALGNEQAIVKRQFEREMKELLGLLEVAQSTGDNALIRKINEAIRKLKEAQNLEFEDQFGTNNSNNFNNSNNNSNNNSDSNPVTNNGNQSITVTLNLNGNATSFDFANQTSADAFISTMEELGEINSQGIG